MGAAEIEAMMARLIEARDPWQELALWLGEQRARNTAMGGDDLQFIHLIAFQTAMVTLPLTSEARRIDRDTARNRPIVSTEVHGLSMAYWSSPSCGAMSDDAPSPPHIPEGRSMMRHALRALRRLDDRISDCWIGHLIGAAALLVLLFPMSIIVGALQ